MLPLCSNSRWELKASEELWKAVPSTAAVVLYLSFGSRQQDLGSVPVLFLQYIDKVLTVRDQALPILTPLLLTWLVLQSQHTFLTGFLFAEFMKKCLYSDPREGTTVCMAKQGHRHNRVDSAAFFVESKNSSRPCRVPKSTAERGQQNNGWERNVTYVL